MSALTPTVAKPLSRERISLIGGEAGPRPLIEFDYHSDDRDRVRHMDAVRRAAGMLLSPEVRPLSSDRPQRPGTSIQQNLHRKRHPRPRGGDAA